MKFGDKIRFADSVDRFIGVGTDGGGAAKNLFGNYGFGAGIFGTCSGSAVWRCVFTGNSGFCPVAGCGADLRRRGVCGIVCSKTQKDNTLK